MLRLETVKLRNVKTKTKQLLNRSIELLTVNCLVRIFSGFITIDNIKILTGAALIVNKSFINSL